MNSHTQALVIGGGVAGGAAAAQLARAGRDVILIECKSGPHDKVCGEFVSSEAALYLRDLGIDLATLGAIRVSAVRLYTRREVATAPLPFPAFSVSRRILDEVILEIAAAAGAEVRRGRRVRSLHARARKAGRPRSRAATRWRRRPRSWPPASTISAAGNDRRAGRMI